MDRNDSTFEAQAPFASLVDMHADRIVHHSVVPARDAVVEPWPEWIDERVRSAFPGIDALWGHQAEALRLLERGDDVAITTGTASGKSLVFWAPILQALADGAGGSALHGFRSPTALYLAPTKALAFDQLRRLDTARDLGRFTTVDGDDDRDKRQWARDHADVVLTNPDTLHHSILPGHQRWTRLLAGLRYIVVDEAHHYRGLFGAHTSHVLRRLLRMCEHYGARPQVVLASATMAEPAEGARRLIGREVPVVTADASPGAERTIVLWEPPLVGSADAPGPSTRRSATAEASDLVTDLVVRGVRTVAFVRSRAGAESLAHQAQQRLDEVDPDLRGRVATYRGGYLPEERRQLESRLRSGELLALASTNALEMGIDIAGLDAVVCVGYPGTRAALHQQLGRAGRGDTPCLGVLVARDEPLDSYLVHHPEALLGAPLEATVFDADNPHVLGPHLAAAAQELVLREDELDRFGPRAREGVDALTAAGWLRRRSTGWFWTRRDRASALADLRGSGGAPVQIVDVETGRLIGTVDAGSADSAVHEHAVYVHQGRAHVVEDYDHEEHVALVRVGDPGYTTMAHSTSEVSIVRIEGSTRWGSITLHRGTVDVISQVVGYRLRAHDGRMMGEEPLDLPERVLRTEAVWWTIPTDVVEEQLPAADVPGAAHAAEHAAIGLLPLFATCDRWDLGGLSTALHADTGQVTIFVHDAHPGGAGFSRRGHDVAAEWLQVTRDTIAACECPSGCPACVYSPKCGNGNEPLDKAGAVALLDLMMADAPPRSEVHSST